MVSLPSQVVTWFESSRGPSCWFLMLCGSVWAGRAVSSKGWSRAIHCRQADTAVCCMGFVKLWSMQKAIDLLCFLCRLCDAIESPTIAIIFLMILKYKQAKCACHRYSIIGYFVEFLASARDNKPIRPVLDVRYSH